MSCSGLALWTRFSTLNQQLGGVRGWFTRLEDSKSVIVNESSTGNHKGELCPHETLPQSAVMSCNVPGVLWSLCVDVVGSLVGHNVQCIFLLVIVHDLPTE